MSCSDYWECDFFYYFFIFFTLLLGFVVPVQKAFFLMIILSVISTRSILSWMHFSRGHVYQEIRPLSEECKLLAFTCCALSPYCRGELF